MQTRNDRCAPCYGRRAVLGPVLGLALAPLLVGVARAEDESEKTDAARHVAVSKINILCIFIIISYTAG